MTNEEALQRLKHDNCDKCVTMYRSEECQQSECAIYHYRQALEKQILKKPIVSAHLIPSILCPRCQEIELGFSGAHYCDFCGQAIDWKDIFHEKQNVLENVPKIGQKSVFQTL